jgi:hypothetical protein
MMIGFAAKAAIAFSYGVGWRRSRKAFDRNLPALAVRQKVSLRRLISIWNSLAVAARATKPAVQFFSALAFFVDAPGMIG